MKKFVLGLCGIFFLAGVFGCRSAGYTKISASEAKEMLIGGGVTLVDVRETYEYAEGHIEGALLLPLGQAESSAPLLLPDKNAVILIYCRSGRRSAEAASKLASLGYKKVYDMGGIIEWQSNGYSVVK